MLLPIWRGESLSDYTPKLTHSLLYNQDTMAYIREATTRGYEDLAAHLTGHFRGAVFGTLTDKEVAQ
jgi:hypothetical protein